MKRNLLPIGTLVAVILTFSTVSKAQLKLGNNATTVNANSILEMETTNKGLLLPRVALTSTTAFAPLTAHIVGMSVYNTATAGDVTPGYYINDGSKWVKLVDTNIYTGDGALTGNRTVTQAANTMSFTSTATNGFSVDGTTFSVDAANNRVGIGTTTPNTKLQATGALTTQFETVGAFNDILHTTGGGAWGFGDASRTLSWSYNLAGGAGGDGLHLFVPGNFRQSANHTDATISLYNDNLGSAAHRVGIATINPATTLDVNGTTKTTNLQVTTGAGTGKILTSDASGNATWQTPTVVGGLGGAFNPIGTTNLIMADGAAEADVPGVTQTFTLTTAATVNVIATGIISNYNTGFVDIQGSFKINVDGTNATAGFASSGNRSGLSAMPTPITLSYNVVLAAGTHTIKMRYKPWYGGANININAFTIPYAGSSAIDADALKSRMSILIFNN
jgi:hypothetical protein